MTAKGEGAAMAGGGRQGAGPGGPGTSGSPARPGSPGRREFLRFAAAAGGASLLSACSGTSSAPTANSSSPGGAAAAAGPPTSADWGALARHLSGPLIRPGESGYTMAKELFDPRFDSLHPAGIAYCRNPDDVATSLAFVRKYGLPVAARCGGHSYAGWASTNG